MQLYLLFGKQCLNRNECMLYLSRLVTALVIEALRLLATSGPFRELWFLHGCSTVTIMSSHCFLSRNFWQSRLQFRCSMWWTQTLWVLGSLSCGFIQDRNWEFKVWPVHPWFHRYPGKAEFHSSNPVTAVVQKERKNSFFCATLEWEFVI